MDIDLGAEIKFNIKHNGQTYVIREPSVKEVLDFQSEAEKDQLSIVKFLDKLGLPQSVSESLSARQIKTIVDTMVGAISEKK